jgi:hypothetical protein
MNATTPSTALVKVLSPLDEPDRVSLRSSLEPLFVTLDRWEAAARDIVVTDEKQLHAMKTARALRLEIKSARVEVDKKRKAMKDGFLAKGRAIDAAFALFETAVKPLEGHLLAQEQYAERAEATRREQLRGARNAALSALGVSPLAMPADLGSLPDAEWDLILNDAREAKSAREHKARLDEEARQKREAEQKAENERLRAEAAERQAKIAALGAVEIKSSTGAFQATSQETAVDPPQTGQTERDLRGESRALAGPPTKAKYMRLLAALREISGGCPLPIQTASRAIREVGEEP